MDVEREMPANVEELVKSIGIVTPRAQDGEEVPQELIDVYARALEGNCMTCGNKCGDTTMVVVTQAGVVMLLCSGACLTDMQVVGWLEEKHDDIRQQIDFRGGAGDGAT